MNMDELDEIEMFDSLSENDSNSSDEKIQKNYTNKNIKHTKQSTELSQEDLNNKIIQAFKSEEIILHSLIIFNKHNKHGLILKKKINLYIPLDYGNMKEKLT